MSQSFGSDVDITVLLKLAHFPMKRVPLSGVGDFFVVSVRGGKSQQQLFLFLSQACSSFFFLQSYHMTPVRKKKKLRSRHVHFGKAPLRYRHFKIHCAYMSLGTVKRVGTDKDFMVHSSAPCKLCNIYSNGHDGCLQWECFYLFSFNNLRGNSSIDF